MNNIDEQMVTRIVSEVLSRLSQSDTETSIRKVQVPLLDVCEADRMDTGNPADQVWTKDLFTLEQSPRLGCGLMVMKNTTFPWTLNYDEIDYVIEGRLEILKDGKTVSAGPGEIILIPKGSSIRFSAPDQARFLYFVYPADWQAQK